MANREITVLRIGVRNAPPTLLIKYCLGNDSTKRYLHQVKLYIKSNATAAQIADELIRKEALYFKETFISRTKLESLIQMLIERKGKAPIVPHYFKRSFQQLEQNKGELLKKEHTIITGRNNQEAERTQETIAAHNNTINEDLQNPEQRLSILNTEESKQSNSRFIGKLD